MAVTIPLVGDRIPDSFPSVIKVVKVTTGNSTAGVDVVSSSQASYALVTLPAGAHIVDVGWRIAEAFTNSVTLELGDTSDSDSWALASDINPTTDAMTHIKMASGAFLDGLAAQLITSDGGDTAAGVQWAQPTYAAPGGGFTVQGGTNTIDLTVGGADPTDGKLEVYVYYHMAFGQKST